MTDGLAALDKQRSRRQSRSIPPSRHAPTARPAETTTQPATSQPVTSQPSNTAPGPPARTETPAAKPQTDPAATQSVRGVPDTPAPQAPAKKPTHPREEASELIRTTLHLGADEDEFLEAVRIAGRGRRPRIDASRSAVARLAINRLAQQLSPDQIVAELTTPTSNPGNRGGRPRR